MYRLIDYVSTLLCLDGVENVCVCVCVCVCVSLRMHVLLQSCRYSHVDVETLNKSTVCTCVCMYVMVRLLRVHVLAEN